LGLRTAARGAGIGLPLLLGMALGRPATAQVTIGSPGDPPRFAIGGGAFDVLPNAHKTGHGGVGLVLAEYRFVDTFGIFSPFMGAMGTGKGAVFVYVGFGFDMNFPYNFVLTPSFSGGYFNGGNGINLGYWWEFRSGAELDYRFLNNRRLGVGFYHISNAGRGNKDPGAELATVVLTAPF